MILSIGLPTWSHPVKAACSVIRVMISCAVNVKCSLKAPTMVTPMLLYAMEGKKMLPWQRVVYNHRWLISLFHSRFVYKIPKSIEPKYAGPLMCAGSTVFSAMYGANLSPTARIGIVGIGGLWYHSIGLNMIWTWWNYRARPPRTSICTCMGMPCRSHLKW